MYRKDQVMNMAKAKIVKRKRRLRIEGLATLLLTLSIFGYFGAKFALKSYNITLQLKAQESEQKANTLKEDVRRISQSWRIATAYLEWLKKRGSKRIRTTLLL